MVLMTILVAATIDSRCGSTNNLRAVHTAA
jgi:hypothetical protein